MTKTIPKLSLNTLLICSTGLVWVYTVYTDMFISEFMNWSSLYDCSGLHLKAGYHVDLHFMTTVGFTWRLGVTLIFILWLQWASLEGWVSRWSSLYDCSGLHLKAGCHVDLHCMTAVGFTWRLGVTLIFIVWLQWASLEGWVSPWSSLYDCSGLHLNDGCCVDLHCMTAVGFTWRLGVTLIFIVWLQWASLEGWVSRWSSLYDCSGLHLKAGCHVDLHCMTAVGFTWRLGVTLTLHVTQIHCIHTSVNVRKNEIHILLFTLFQEVFSLTINVNWKWSDS